MDLLLVILIGIGLSADAFAVAVARSFASRALSMKGSLVISASFGFFQALMPVVGWLAGMQLLPLISGIDHWVAFGLLVFIGAKMIYESRMIREEEKNPELDGYVLLLLSLATSMDALAVGLSLSFLKTPILEPALIIGVTTFAISLAGCILGRRFGHLLEEKVEIAGGLVLIAIGLKILVEHVGLPF